ncbi:MAG TPA: hypothetical protein VK889_00775 [Solirubrobacterales bacterium]|nr:hypothetical protein [Solirubrobacterales bacterium]
MSPRRRRAATALAATLSLALSGLLPGLPAAEVVEDGPLRVSFFGRLAPQALPRSGSAPVGVDVGARISSANSTPPPQLRRISIAINRNGRFSPGLLPACRVEQIQPATTQGALEACRASLVGRGSFSARILLPAQAPFPSKGEVYAYNGVYEGRPAILAHVYGTEPAPVSYTLPFQISTIARGTFGTLLSASLPQATSEWGYVTGLQLSLGRNFSRHGERHGFVSASCPAPAGFRGAVFPFARATFAFSGGIALRSTLTRSCRVLAARPSIG